MTKIEVENVSS